MKRVYRTKKHIAMLVLTLTRGGAETVVANLCNDKLVNDYDVTIITCLKKPVGQKLDERIKHICLEDKENIVYKSIADRFIKRRKRLNEVLADINPDIVVSLMPEPNMLALSLKKSLDIPVIISVRNDPKHEYASKAYYAMMRWLYPKADGYVFQTEDAKAYFDFDKHIQDTGAIIPNPLSSAYRDCEFVPIDSRNKVIISAGKLEKQKNQRLVIDAFARIADKYKDYELHIHGNGSLYNALRQQADALGIGDRVIITENVPDLKDRLSNCSLFVLSSDYEGMPNVLMEAMAVGAPCISTDCPCGGPKFLINDGEDGILVPVGDESSLAKAMDRVLDDRSLADKLGRNAMFISSRLDANQINDRWVKYIEEILCGN